MGALLQKVEGRGGPADGGIQLRIGAGYVGTKLNQILRVVIDRERFADLLNVGKLSGTGDLRRQTADGIEDVDGGIVTRGAELPRQDDMTIQDASDAIANRLIKIVAFHKHCEEPGNRPAAKVA